MTNHEIILKKLNKAGFKAFIVGGAVRDMIMSRRPKDFDIVTNASPADIDRVFKDDKRLHIGEAFGIITVLVNGEPIEIAQMRKDGNYSDGRRPDVVIPVDDIKMDLARRDFTMNAIARDLDGEQIDPFGGAWDIHAKTIRFVGDSAQRIIEDKLRILRAFRFMSQLGFTIEKESLESINTWVAVSPDFSSVSQERITAEFLKIIAGQNAFATIKLMMEIGILSLIIPEFDTLWVDHNNHWHLEIMQPFGKSILAHVMHVFKLACERNEDVIIRLAALFHDIGKPLCIKVKLNGENGFTGHDLKGAELTAEIMQRMKFPNEMIEKVSKLVKAHMRMHDLPKMKKVHKIRKLLGREDIDQLIELSMCDTLGSHNEKGEPIYNQAELTVNAVNKYRAMFPVMLPKQTVTGIDLIAAGLTPGPDFKERLDKAYNLQLDGETVKRKMVNFAVGLIF